MFNFKRIIIFFGIISLNSTIFPMVYDNRFFPLYEHIYSRTKEKPSVFIGDLFVMTANDAAKNNDDSIGIPEILGNYDLNKLANAIVDLGRPNPFIGTQFEQYLGREIPYRMKGKLQAQGLAFAYYQSLTENVGIGATWFAMHVFSRINFMLAENTLGLTTEQVRELDALRRCMQNSIGLEAPKWSKSGFSDIDLYLRFGNIWNYTYKFRRIDAGVRTGVMIPTGVRRDANNPASVPFGGDGHWGIYLASDLEIEFKEDWIAGFLFRFNKRFGRKKIERLPLAGEQPLFGALLGEAHIDPGITFIFCPYLRFEDIRDGLGIQAKYTIVTHFDDLIKDARVGTPSPEPMLQPWINVTDWTSEYLTLKVFYDFARVRVDKYYAPVFSLTWDIPIQFFLTERVSKTSRVALGIKFSF
ncbi:MAG: hypothetical protein WDZ41_01040 [Candidatus Babeliales bacterium]